jgi:hypothetical protein
MKKVRWRFGKKGQVFSLDLIISMFTFIIILIFLLSFWNLNSLRLSEKQNSNELQLIALQVMDILVSTPGEPFNWNTNNATSIGLATRLGKIDQGKLNAFLDYDYAQSKSRFNIERFEYKFTVTSSQDVLINSSGIESGDVDEKVALSRLVFVGNEVNKIIFELWRSN